MESGRANRRNWPLLLGPQAFAGWPEGAIFSTLCVMMLLLLEDEAGGPAPPWRYLALGLLLAVLSLCQVVVFFCLLLPAIVIGSLRRKATPLEDA